MAQPFRALRRCSPWSPLGLWGSGCSECPDLQCFHISISPYSMDLMVFRSSDLGQIWDLGISGSRGSLDPRIWGHPGITRNRGHPGLDIPVHSGYSALSLGMATWPSEGYSAWSQDGPWGPPRRASKGPQNGPFWTPFGPHLNDRSFRSGYLRSGDLFWTPFGPLWTHLGPFGVYWQPRTPFRPFWRVRRGSPEGPF
jgi:hypothetical protein